MADTLPSVDINAEWQAVSVLTGGTVPAGMGCIIQNQSEYRIYAAISAEQPEADFMGIIIPSSPDRPLHVTAGESEVWLMTRSHFIGRANVQVA